MPGLRPRPQFSAEKGDETSILNNSGKHYQKLMTC